MALSEYAKPLLSGYLYPYVYQMPASYFLTVKCFRHFFTLFLFFLFYSVAIIRDVVQRRFEVYHKLEEAARLAVEQEAAAKAAEERKKAEGRVKQTNKRKKTEGYLNIKSFFAVGDVSGFY